MKKHLALALSLGAVLALSSPAWSIPVSIVGETDTLIGRTDLGSSGEATEEAWVESILGFDVTLTYKLDEAGNWEQVVDADNVNVANTFALALENSPEYFLVKTGNLDSVSSDPVTYTHFLFDNRISLDYAVVDFTNMGYDPLVSKVTKVSHNTEFGGTRVPEPSTLLLLGAGLLGVGLLRRKKKIA